MFKRSIKILVLTLCFFLSIEAHAKKTKRKAVEVSYLAGYDAYLNESNAVCAEEFEYIKDKLRYLPKEYRTRAKLYHAYCNTGLKQRVYAATIIQELDAAKLGSADRQTYELLASNLHKEIEDLNSYHPWVFPYYGSISFAPHLVDDAGSLYGLQGGIRYRNWELSAAAQQMNLNNVDGSTYSEGLYNIYYARSFSKFSLRTFFTYVLASTDSRRSVGVLGLGAVYPFKPTTIVSADLSYSHYPSAPLGGVSASQLTLSLDQNVYTWEKVKLNAQAASETIMTTANEKEDTVTEFELDPLYMRWVFGGIVTMWEVLSVGANTWFGKEALGVRNQGTLIFNKYVNYKSGFGLSIAWTLYPNWTAKLNYSKETFSIVSQDVTSTTIIVGLNAAF